MSNWVNINGVLRHKESKPFQKWCRDVKKRDNRVCQVCGDDGKNEIIQAHHIKPIEQYPDIALDLDNGMTVCIHCHKLIHKELRKNKMKKELMLSTREFETRR